MFIILKKTRNFEKVLSNYFKDKINGNNYGWKLENKIKLIILYLTNFKQSCLVENQWRLIIKKLIE